MAELALPSLLPEYTVLTVVAVVAVVAFELLVLRTGMFRRPVYWVSMAIVLGFQVLVDGWLTKLSAPVVLYDEAMTLGIRAPWDIPVEDFGFGFAMVTLALGVWLRATRARGRSSAPSHGAPADRGAHAQLSGTAPRTPAEPPEEPR